MELSEQDKDRYRLQILESIELREAKLREIIAADHPLVRDGEVVTDPQTGQVVLDPGPAEEAAIELAKTLKQRDELLGLAPPRTLQVSVPADAAPEEVQRLVAEALLADDEADETEDTDGENGEDGDYA